MMYLSFHTPGVAADAVSNFAPAGRTFREMMQWFYLWCPRRHSPPIKCVPGPVWTERTSPPCSPPRMTGADPQTHTTSWWTRAVQMSQMKNTKETKNQEGFFSFCISLAFFQSFLCTKVQSRGYFFFFFFSESLQTGEIQSWDGLWLCHMWTSHICAPDPVQD